MSTREFWPILLSLCAAYSISVQGFSERNENSGIFPFHFFLLCSDKGKVTIKEFEIQTLNTKNIFPNSLRLITLCDFIYMLVVLFVALLWWLIGNIMLYIYWCSYNKKIKEFNIETIFYSIFLGHLFKYWPSHISFNFSNWGKPIL